MGLINPRAICPRCGAKIHTQRSYTLRALTLRERFQATGKQCPHCHVRLTGTVKLNNKAVLAEHDKAPASGYS